MTTLAQAWPMARKAHRCDSCSRRIEPGERYRRWTGTGDPWDGVATEKRCADCCERYGHPIPPAKEKARQAAQHALRSHEA